MSKRKTVLYVSDTAQLWYKSGRLYYKSGEHAVSCVLQGSIMKRLLSKVRLFERLLRLSPRTSIRLDEHSFLISYDGKIYRWDVLANDLQVDHAFRKEMNNLLSFTRIEGVQGFDDSIVYGEYFMNPSRLPVAVWQRDQKGKWKATYQFEGNIIHIHAIVPDAVNGCVYILTGDFGDEAAIWVARNNFKEVSPLQKGEQKYRGCVGFATKKGLLYATDAPTEPNALYLINSVGETTKIMDMPGPTIYGTEHKGIYYFATSVEPDTNLPTWRYFLSRKPGPGIKDNYTHVFAGNLESGFKEIAKYKKDVWPLTLFQFANVMFPECEMQNKVCLMPASVNKYDNVPVFLSE